MELDYSQSAVGKPRDERISDRLVTILLRKENPEDNNHLNYW